MTRARGEVRAGSGATKNTRNFVFSAVDNGGGKEETVEEDAQVQGNLEPYKSCSQLLQVSAKRWAQVW